MTEFTMNFWQKANGRLDIERVYFHGASAVRGHIERCQILRALEPWAKPGDPITGNKERLIWWFENDQMLDEALIALGSSRAAWDALTDDYERFAFFAKRAKNGWPCWLATTPKAEIKRLRLARDKAVYQIAASAITA